MSNHQTQAAAAAIAILLLLFATLIWTQQGDLANLLPENATATEPVSFSDLNDAAELSKLSRVLEDATFDMVNHTRTVFVAPLNKAWAANGSMFDTFLESLRDGDGTSFMLDHLVIFALDQGAYERCTKVHKRCVALRTEGVDFSQEKSFMTEDYLKMTRRKIFFLEVILRLGFDFLFTDIDIVWFRPPFQHFSRHADVDVACDYFNGNSTDMENQLNTGVLHVRSSQRTISLYKYWQEQLKVHSEAHDQNVVHLFKHTPEFRAFGVKFNFMPTEYFSGFCELSKNMETVCTMHAICCVGLSTKHAALKGAVEDWNLFKSMTPQESREQGIHFRHAQSCPYPGSEL